LVTDEREREERGEGGRRGASGGGVTGARPVTAGEQPPPRRGETEGGERGEVPSGGRDVAMRVEEEIGPERDPEGEEIDWGTLWAGPL